jgi:hypothetical protein
LPLDLHSFSSFRASRFGDEWYWKRYVDFNELSQSNKNISALNKIVKGWFPIIGNGEMFLTVLVPNKYKNKIIKGQAIQVKMADFSRVKNREDIAIKRAKIHLENSKVIEGISYFYFKKIIQLAKQKNINIVLIKYPVTEEYFNATKNYISNTDAHYFKIINNINDANIPTLDYQKYFFGEPALFKDSDHLNQKGAEILSKKINQDLKELNLT